MNLHSQNTAQTPSNAYTRKHTIPHPNRSIRESIPSIQIHSLKVLPHSQIPPALHVLNDQALLISQMQQTNKPVRSRNIRHLLFRVNVLEVVHYVDEVQRFVWAFREGGDGWAAGCLGRLLLWVLREDGCG